MIINDETLIDCLIEKNRELYSLVKSHNDTNLFDLWKASVQRLINASNPTQTNQIYDQIYDLCFNIYKPLSKYFCGKFNLQKSITNRNTGPSILKKPEKYIELLKKEQEFAFKTNFYKRDNVIHQFRVFLLGYYLILNSKRIREWLCEDIKNLWAYNPNDYYYKNGEFIFNIWALTSLFHDMGRGIETCYKTLNDIKNTFEPIFREFYIDLPIQDTGFPPKNIWHKKKETFLKLFDYFYKEKMDNDLYDKLKNTFKSSLNKPKHGLISALLMILPEFENILQNWGEHCVSQFKNPYDNAEEDSSVFEEIIDSMELFNYYPEAFHKEIIPLFYAAVAVALHDVEEFWFATRLTALLVLCDNLQEWCRLTKLGDQLVMIFPCNKIKLEYKKGNGNDILSGVEVYYDPSHNNSCIENAIFSRWEPKKKWEDFKNKINKNNQIKQEVYIPCFKKAIIFKISWEENNKKLYFEFSFPL